MSDLIRIGAGTITAYDLANTASYLVTNFTRQTDMTASDQWQASQPDKGLRSEYVSSIELGSGNLYGGYSGVIEFFHLTELMQQYIHTNILSDKPVAKVTAYLYNDFTRAWGAYVGELVSPHVANAEAEYTVFGRERYWNNQYVFRNAVLATVSNLLLETGDVILTESGDSLALESQ